MKRKIGFKLFGGISVLLADGQQKALNEIVGGNIGKKQCAFLAYMLLNHNNKISSEELIEHFWSGDGKDPANSLKNMIHKIRALLKTAFPEEQDLLMTRSGYYEWAPDIQIELDTEVMDQLYHDAKNLETAERVDLRLKAFMVYTGDILPGTSLEWLDHLNTYYRTVYIDICRSLVIQLLDESRWDEVIAVCNKAYTLAPEMEEFTLCAIQAMVNSGMPGQAIRRYEDYRSMLWNEFSLVPSSAIEQAYTLAVYATKEAEDYEEKIIQRLSSPPDQREAFHCSLLVFQNIVQLELRHMERSQRPSTIVILHAEERGQAEPSSTDIRRVERILLQCLRAGDPFTRLNRGSFALLLPGATVENSQKVMERVRRDFCTMYPRSKAHLRFSFYPLQTDPEV